MFGFLMATPFTGLFLTLQFWEAGLSFDEDCVSFGWGKLFVPGSLERMHGLACGSTSFETRARHVDQPAGLQSVLPTRRESSMWPSKKALPRLQNHLSEPPRLGGGESPALLLPDL